MCKYLAYQIDSEIYLPTYYVFVVRGKINYYIYDKKIAVM